MAKRTWITVKRGILEPKHRFALGELIYLFLYILDITGWETGTIEEWSDKGVAEEMDMPLSTLRYQRNKLTRLGYISVEQKQHGIRVNVHNWTNPKEYTGKVYNKSKIPSANPSTNPSNNPSANPSFKDEPTNAVPSYSHKSQIIVSENKSEKKDLHTAIKAYRGITSRYPRKELYDDVIGIIGDSPDTAKLAACYKEWLRRGYNANSINWLDWYTNGIPTYKKGPPTPAPKIYKDADGNLVEV